LGRGGRERGGTREQGDSVVVRIGRCVSYARTFVLAEFQGTMMQVTRDCARCWLM
jgi:hypothetical protein